MKTRAIKTAAIAIIASVFLTGEVVAREPLPDTFNINAYLGTVSGFLGAFTTVYNTQFQGKKYDGMAFHDGLGVYPSGVVVPGKEDSIEMVLIDRKFLRKYSSSKVTVAPGAVFKFVRYGVNDTNRAALTFEFNDAGHIYSTVFFVNFHASSIGRDRKTYFASLARAISYEYYICASRKPPLNCVDITP